MKDPKADWADLRIMRNDQTDVQVMQVCNSSLSNLELAQLTAKLNVLKMKLECERANWKLHLSAVRQYEEGQHIAQTAWREDGASPLECW